MQIGILVLAIYLWFHVRFIRSVLKIKNKKNDYLVALKLGFIVASVFLAVDFFIYLSIFAKSEVIRGIYILSAAIILRIAYNENESIETTRFKNQVWLDIEFENILTDNFQIIKSNFSGSYLD